MGCVFSHPRTQDGRADPHLFKVINMDRDGQERNKGKVEITETELIFHQRHKNPVQWPLRSLRRYGYDADLFSFESGRRCPTGQGIYAFKCDRAQALFNMLQDYIVRAGQQNNANDDASLNARPASGAIDTASSRPLSVGDVHIDNNTPRHNSFPVILTQQHGTSNVANSVSGVVSLQAFPQISSNRHEYMNGDTVPVTPKVLQPGNSSQSHFASVDAGGLMPSGAVSPTSVKSVELSQQVLLPPEPSESRIQYVELDLRGTQTAAEEEEADGVVLTSPSTPGAVAYLRNISHDSNHANYMNLETSGGTELSNGMVNNLKASRNAQLSSSIPLMDAPAPPGLPGPSSAAGDSQAANYLNLSIPMANACAASSTPEGVTYVEVDFANNDRKANATTTPTSLVAPEGLTVIEKTGQLSDQASSPSVSYPAATAAKSSGALSPTVGQTLARNYAVIDFQKTAAINPKNAQNLADEGARKTRHDSNIEDINSNYGGMDTTQRGSQLRSGRAFSKQSEITEGDNL